MGASPYNKGRVPALGIRRLKNESWHDCAMRYGKKYGLEQEVAEEFKLAKQAGESDAEAAWGACMEWDICELM